MSLSSDDYDELLFAVKSARDAIVKLRGTLGVPDATVQRTLLFTSTLLRSAISDAMERLAA